jgi:ribosomal protein S12
MAMIEHVGIVLSLLLSLLSLVRTRNINRRLGEVEGHVPGVRYHVVKRGGK